VRQIVAGQIDAGQKASSCDKKPQATSCGKLTQGQCVMLTAKLTQGAWQKASSFKLQAAAKRSYFFLFKNANMFFLIS